MHSAFHTGSRIRQEILWQLGGVLLAGATVIGLLFQFDFVWALCPQALIVMFCRQAMAPYDSLGAADYPDLAMPILYFPLVAWLLSRAHRSGNFSKTTAKIGLWHLMAVVASIGAAMFRNHVWSTP
jgi:hypothetical protein